MTTDPSQLQTTCRQLLEKGTVQLVIGYGQSRPDGPPHPVFVTDPQRVGQLVWNERCELNLTVFLKRREVRELGKAAVVVKACDERAVVVLEQESQLDRQNVYLIGAVCGRPREGGPAKCRSCTQRTPQFADILIASADSSASGSADDSPQDTADEAPYAALEEFHRLSPAQRLAYWQREFQRCTRCYACRQACPLCYCTRCIVDKNRPVCIDPAATPQANFAWHVTRAFHLAGRCVGCDQCTLACPAGIDLRLLNLSLARAAEEQFGYRAGQQADAEPLIGCYREQDQESFIR